MLDIIQPTNINPKKFIKTPTQKKKQILKDNKGKSGVYCLRNLINNKIYIGSSNNLSNRFYDYYSVKCLEQASYMYIYRALLKYGYSNFSLEILEYCDVKDLLEREKFYFKLLKPEYNICKEPASPMLGRTHSEETLAKMSAWTRTE